MKRVKKALDLWEAKETISTLCEFPKEKEKENRTESIFENSSQNFFPNLKKTFNP